MGISLIYPTQKRTVTITEEAEIMRQCIIIDASPITLDKG